eukprot:15365572-Ditylum_brightwellii.AAC.1
MVKFRMKSTLIHFKDKYYKYNEATGNKEIYNEDIRLAIGEHFTDTIIHGTYRDNGLVVFNSQRSPEKI